MSELDKSMLDMFKKLSLANVAKDFSVNAPHYSHQSLTDTDEGEFETLINRYDTGQIQPRSGPPYPRYDEDPFGSRSMKMSSYDDYHSSSRPTLTDPLSKKEIAAGKMPSAMHEFDRLIDPDDPLSAEFHSKMMEITNRLQIANYGAVQKEFRFVIMDQPHVNAHIYSTLNPPVICITKVTIETFETEDELAGLIAHELTHRNVFDQTQEASGATNPEEAGADVWAVHLMQHAGYAPTAMLSMLEKLYDTDTKRRRKSVFERRDPHPPYNVRKRNVEDAVAYYEMKTELRTETTQLNPDLKESVASVKHVPYILQKFEEKNPVGLSPDEQAQFMIELWNEDLKNLDPNPFMARFNDFENLLSITVKAGADPACFDPLVKAIFKFEGQDPNHKDRAKSLFKTISKAYGVMHQDDSDGMSFRPIGPLAVLETAMKGFIEAADQSDMEAHAKLINDIAPQYDFANSSIISRIRWPDFKVEGIREIDRKLKGGEPCALSWSQHQLWAETSPEIANALRRFRVHNEVKAQDVEPYHIQRKSIEWGRYGYNPQEHLQIDAQGQITAHNVKRIKRKKLEPTRFENGNAGNDATFLQIRDEEAKELLKTVDWSILQSNFWGFVEEHKDQLMPQITSASGGDLFQKAFCEQCAVLLSSGKRKDKANIIEFFSANPSYEEQNNDDPKNTVRSLISKFTNFYRISAGVKNPNAGRQRYSRNHFMEDRLHASNYQVGLSINGPYAEFIANDLSDQMSAKNKFSFFAHTRWRTNKQAGHISHSQIKKAFSVGGGDDPEDGAFKPEELISFDFRTIFGYDKPQSADELFEAIDHLMDISGGLNGSNAELLKHLINTEIYSYLSLEKDETLDVKRLFDLCTDGLSGVNSYIAQNFTIQFLSHDLMGHDFKREHNKKFITLLDRQLGYMFDAQNDPASDVEEFFKIYTYLNQGDYKNTSFFDRNRGLKEKYEAKLKDRYQQIKDPFLRTKLLRNLLCDTKLTNISFRQWVSDEWIKSTGFVINEGLKNEYGKVVSLNNMAQDITENAQMGQAVFLLNGLLEEIEAQEDDAFMVRDILKSHFLKKGLKQDLVASANDYVLERIGDEPKIRMNFIEFITNPYSNENASNFIDAVHQLEGRYQDDLLRFLQKDEDDKGLEITEEMKLNALQNVYSNFWGLPFAARTLYLERVLFPVDEHSDEAFEKAISYITNKMLPQGEPYMDQARLILTTHLEESSKPLQRLIFSALMTANEQNETASEKMRPGQILSHVLGRSGAAGGKILQAAHSYLQSLPDSDDDLREFIDDLESSKSNYNKLFRWDMLKRVKDVFIPKKGRPTPRVGKQFGAGSYGFTVELDYMNGLKTALTLAREGVASEANYHFKWFKRTAEKLSVIDSFWTPLINILGNAQEMSGIESDFNIGAQQIKYAEGLYNGISIKADGYSFDISTASLYHHGLEFKETDVAHGDHFLDLPETTVKEKRYKKAAAKALLCAEIHAILKGGAFDYDRHGAQCKLQGDKIVLFDHGSISYDIKEGKISEPNTNDKRALGELLASSYTDAQNSKRSVNAILISKMNDTSEFGESAHYIECFKRGLLALNDYIKYAGVDQLERDQVVQESIAQSIKTDLADPSIIDGFKQGMGDQHSKSTKSLYLLVTSSVILTDQKGKTLLQQGVRFLFERFASNSFSRIVIPKKFVSPHPKK